LDDDCVAIDNLRVLLQSSSYMDINYSSLTLNNLNQVVRKPSKPGKLKPAIELRA